MKRTLTLCALLVACVMLAGCENGGDPPTVSTSSSDPAIAGTRTAPSPLDSLLPADLEIHAFTGKQTFDSAGNPMGFEVRIKMLDADGDPVKAYGDYSFALYLKRPRSADPRGTRLDWWSEDLTEHADNQLHWDPISLTYKFNLRLKQSIAPGQELILDTFFVSPYTTRLHAERFITIAE